MEITLPNDVQNRLNKINWDNLKEKYGITKEAILKNPVVASQLAYGQMTDLGRVLDRVGIDPATRMGGSLQFFIYDVIKIMILLGVLIF